MEYPGDGREMPIARAPGILTACAGVVSGKVLLQREFYAQVCVGWFVLVSSVLLKGKGYAIVDIRVGQCELVVYLLNTSYK